MSLEGLEWSQVVLMDGNLRLGVSLRFERNSRPGGSCPVDLHPVPSESLLDRHFVVICEHIHWVSATVVQVPTFVSWSNPMSRWKGIDATPSEWSRSGEHVVHPTNPEVEIAINTVRLSR